MAIGWYICGYKTRIDPKTGQARIRYCAMDDFTATITADSGWWAESEVLGGYAVVKVRASATTLTTIAGTTGFQRIPAAFLNLSDTLSSLTSGQRNAILTTLQDMGYTLAEISAALGSNLAGWRNHTLGDLLRFIAQRRLQPRWDDIQGQIVLDGILQSCRPVAEVDNEVGA